MPPSPLHPRLRNQHLPVLPPRLAPRPPRCSLFSYQGTSSWSSLPPRPWGSGHNRTEGSAGGPVVRGVRVRALGYLHPPGDLAVGAQMILAAFVVLLLAISAFMLAGLFLRLANKSRAGRFCGLRHRRQRRRRALWNHDVQIRTGAY